MKRPAYDFLPTTEAAPVTAAAPAVTPKPAKTRKKGKDKDKGQAGTEPKAKKDKGDKADSIWLSDPDVGHAFRVYCHTMKLKIGATATDVFRHFLRGKGIVV